MKFTAQQIAEILNGEIVGNAEVEVNSLAKIEEGKKGDLCFLANEKYTPHIYTTKASIIIVNLSFTTEKEIASTLIKVEDAYSSFSELLELYNKIQSNEAGISKKADIDENSSIGDTVFVGAFTSIDEDVTIGKNVKIYHNCYIGKNVAIGDNTIIYPNVSIYHNCIIGNNNIIHSGVVIGSDGFGFAPNAKNNYDKIHQIGNVILDDDVEVGANTTIDRATMGSTKIGKGVKLDNLIQIAHNVEIGNNTVIAAQVGVAGSSKIGKNCMIGGQTAVSGHLTIADEVKIAGQSGIASSIKEVGKIVQGPMAFDIRDFQRSYIIFKKLPDLYRTVNAIKKQIND
ncbi:MAG: UDP-3-O-(3-hydroxymyristoyl)glucosamine N-acyltransferase [Flavobacteriales bacterium]|jgi:UDP-3-O-[3-hydroxymyristoyl] glucosamine N-acyltransferase|nr:UDP-3-O-(3-hydroxymyristoyl)glucosamine N-acyltransferase [Flavobacteriales bacterium]MBT5090380.1 UDP-3-O-(3-hydroxymyristoyl)glucosamine N-acyltransferase [Flavobacteriales bacterium]MBT5750699.1 UDP-3-O-(3-hydroxymyristoyl)glucosamine N-acyltransferase [Flavobacteriales bacterium]